MPSVMINHRAAVNGLRIRKSNSWYASLLISYLIYKNRINILLGRTDKCTVYCRRNTQCLPNFKIKKYAISVVDIFITQYRVQQMQIISTVYVDF